MATPVKAILLPLDVAQALGVYLLRQPMGAVEAFVTAIRTAPVVDVNETPTAPAVAPSPPAVLRAVPGRAHDLMNEDT
jgi:hypothetical protein